jgi:hypothetical protein
MPLDVAVFTTMAGLCAGRSATVCTACLNSGARFRAGYQHLIADLEGSSLYGAISVDSKGGRVYQNQLVEPHVTRLAAVSTFYLNAGSDNIFRLSDQVDAPELMRRRASTLSPGLSELIDRRVRVGDNPAAVEFADGVGHLVAPAWEIHEDSAIS